MEMESFIRFGIVILAFILFVIGAYLYFQKATTAASSAMLFVVLLIFVLTISNYKRIKFFGLVEAEMWEEKQAQAEEIIERIRRLSTLSARVTYLTMAWSNRWGEPSARERMSVLDDIDKQLQEMNVTPQERKAITRPLTRMVGVDLYNIYVRVFTDYMNARKEKTPEDAAKETEWRLGAVGKGPYYNLEGYDFARELERASPLTWLEPRNHEAANKFKAELIELFAGCERKGGYTPQYADFYDKYSKVPEGTNLKMKELFGLNNP